jgi:hypothetical protein
MFRWMLIGSAIVMAGVCAGCTQSRPSAGTRITTGQTRPAKNDADLRFWLEDMVWYHRFMPAETMEVTGLSRRDLEAALKRFDIRPDNRPKRAADAPILVLPYPGGRHPRIGFLEGAVNPQRETKVSIFAPWDENSYVVADIPEAIWFDGGKLLYLAHTHIPTVWDEQGIKLPPLEWRREADGVLVMERTLPNGVTFGTKVMPGRDAVRMEMWLTNSSNETLTGLKVQNCMMPKQVTGMANQSSENKVSEPPFIACGTRDGTKWIITAWDHCWRTWDNPDVPCFHSDPQFPDCAPGETKRLRGWVSFYEGTDVASEMQRLIHENGWLQEPLMFTMGG